MALNKAAQLQKVKMALKAEKDTESNEESDEDMNEEFEEDALEQDEDIDSQDEDVDDEEEEGSDADEEENESDDKDAAEKDNEENDNKSAKTRKEEYSIFIGNLPTSAKESELKAMFSKYGKIVSIRFRSNTGAKLKFKHALKQVPFLNAYVRFSTKEDMDKACEMDGKTVGANRIRVCPAAKKQIGDPRSTVFVGNLPRGIPENDLYNFFDRVGPIEFVRMVGARNVAFVCFRKGVSIMKALKLNGEMLQGRPVRVLKVDENRTNVKVNKKGNVVPANRLPGGPGGKSAPKGGAKNGDVGAKNGGDSAFHGKTAKKGDNKGKASKKKGSNSVRGKKIIAQKLKAAAAGVKK